LNSLLERVQAGERQTCLADTAEDERTLALLEWDRITHQIASFCLNREASEQIRQRRPYRQREPLQLWWDLTDELRPDGDAGRWPPLVDISTGWKLLDPSTAGQFTGPELVHLAGLAEDLDALRTYLCRARAPFPREGARIQVATAPRSR